jgi:hypothetical protein
LQVSGDLDHQVADKNQKWNTKKLLSVIAAADRTNLRRGNKGIG